LTKSSPAEALLSAAAVRSSAGAVLQAGLAGQLAAWRVDLGKLPAAADVVTEVIRDRYPDLDVPFHARWRHFVVGGRDLWAERVASTSWPNAEARARAAFDLAITSVLLDAGAGPDWRYADAATGAALGRSEGLALASLRMVERGAFSTQADAPLRVDAAALAGLTAEALAEGFQVSAANPLVGLQGRVRLLNRLGAQLAARPDLFATADTPRPGGLFDVLKARAKDGRLAAAEILTLLLEALGPIWEGRPSLAGRPLGDCWLHPRFGFVPIHKLSQWLSYSLIEPLQAAGVQIVAVDGLTGLAEYRNGGLMCDMGVLSFADAGLADGLHDVSSPLVVEWRAMTVALLDLLAPMVRARLGVGEAALPLARVLEGGTWAAGRRIASLRRADGGPPFRINSDGTVF
jgi:hypothetical protein